MSVIYILRLHHHFSQLKTLDVKIWQIFSLSLGTM